MGSRTSSSSSLAGIEEAPTAGAAAAAAARSLPPILHRHRLPCQAPEVWQWYDGVLSSPLMLSQWQALQLLVEQVGAPYDVWCTMHALVEAACGHAPFAAEVRAPADARGAQARALELAWAVQGLEKGWVWRRMSPWLQVGGCELASGTGRFQCPACWRSMHML